MARNKSLLVLGLILVLVACSSGEEEADAEKRKADSLAACEKPVFDEYKASELADLMRKMDADMRIYREHLEKGRIDSLDLSMDYSTLKTATPTDPTVKTDVFAGMADAYLFNVGKLRERPENAQEIFNTTVNSCLTCHQQFCPGPMVRIRKLLL
ncbi:MAG TPA: hypothetical protein DEP18_04690 [Flavobacteriales bacterium]|nr:hypothetical protein [Flavobacteriales bacterium]HRE98797.1 hypothetical protein [Flavobacteriales bacterium]